MEIRLFCQEDAIETAQVIANTLRTCNSRDNLKLYLSDIEYHTGVELQIIDIWVIALHELKHLI